MSVTIGDGRKYLEIHVAGTETVYEVPLLGSLPLSVHRTLVGFENDKDGNAATDFFIEFFKTYTSEEFVDGLTLDDMRTLMQAWRDESEAASGAKVGES